MPINVTMPALSPTMEEGNLAKWLVAEGDSVSAGDIIAEIETDKATMEVEAVDEGTLAKIVVPGGTEGVKVNDVIAILAAEGEDVAEAAKSGGGSDPAPSGDDKGGAMTADAKADNAAKGSEEDAKDPSKRGYSRAEGGTGDGSVQEATESAGPAPKTEEGDRVFSSPLARRLAKEAGIDLAQVKGSGPHGRVVKADIEEAKDKGTGKAASADKPKESAKKDASPAPAPAAKGPSDDAILKMFEEGSYEKIPHDGMRKTIAKRLVESKQTVPHFYLSVDCELDALLALRKQLNDAAPKTKTDDGEKPAYKLSVNDMVIKAMALALKAVPTANVSWTDTAMLKHKHADVGVAVSIDGGLITPIIRRAEEKTLSTISNEMKDLAKRARARKLQPQEYQGGTTAVSNLGMFGINNFSAVINPPHATILAVGAGEERAIVKNGEVKVATLMTVTLSTDHRAVDGALGAELIAAFKQYIENPMGMLV